MPSKRQCQPDEPGFDSCILVPAVCDCGLKLGFDPAYLDRLLDVVIPCPLCGGTIDLTLLLDD